MTFGEQNTQDEGFEQMDYALDRGINFFDTAELYAVMPRKETYGKTEEIIGNWFRERKNRDKIILASKIASEILGGKGGGGRKDFAQAGGSHKEKIDEAFKILYDEIS